MMKKLFALLVAGFVASAAFAQEAPDVLVQRVTEEVLEIIRNDKHGLYTQEDLESAEREHALIELEIAQIEAGWRTR